MFRKTPTFLNCLIAQNKKDKLKAEARAKAIQAAIVGGQCDAETGAQEIIHLAQAAAAN
jgi:hypothetical protein